MKKLILLTFSIIFSLTSIAQITRQNEQFEEVHVIKNKVSFVKEVTLKSVSSSDGYEILKEWGRKNYGKDPFMSSIRYDARKNEIIAKSRVELILPENSQGVREKVVMRFRVDGFIVEDKCVLEITELSFLCESTNKKDKRLSRIIRAEDFITDEKIAEADDLQEIRANTRKAALYFLNSLGKDFEEQFGY